MDPCDSLRRLDFSSCGVLTFSELFLDDDGSVPDVYGLLRCLSDIGDDGGCGVLEEVEHAIHGGSSSSRSVRWLHSAALLRSAPGGVGEREAVVFANDDGCTKHQQQ